MDLRISGVCYIHCMLKLCIYFDQNQKMEMNYIFKKKFFFTLLLLFFLSECTSKQKLLCVFFILLYFSYILLHGDLFSFWVFLLLCSLYTYIYTDIVYTYTRPKYTPYMVCMIVSNEPWKSTRKLLVFLPFRKQPDVLWNLKKSANFLGGKLHSLLF